MLELLTDNHYDKIIDLFESAQKSIVIISPFLSQRMAEKLCSCVQSNGLECSFVTRLYLEDIYSKVNSIEAIEMMIKSGIKVYAQNWLHTKLYIFDSNAAIVGSANFTTGGFKTNVELSLLIQNEDDVISQICEYCASEIEKLENKNGQVTPEMLEKVKSDYQHLLDSKKNPGVYHNNTMYGVDTRYKRFNGDSFEEKMREVTSGVGKDIMQEVFRENISEVKYDYTVWLKFSGSGSNRIDPNSRYEMAEVEYNGAKKYILNYSTKVKSIKCGDIIFLAALSLDTYNKGMPVIVGSAEAVSNSGDEQVLSAWCERYVWMKDYPYYCIVDNVKVINTEVCNGIHLRYLWDKLGSDTYLSSFGKNEDITDVAKKHYRRAHIRLSGNAKDLLEQKLAELGEKYGYITYHSQI